MTVDVWEEYCNQVSGVGQFFEGERITPEGDYLQVSQKFEGLFAWQWYPSQQETWGFMLKLEMETLEIRIAKCTYI